MYLTKNLCDDWKRQTTAVFVRRVHGVLRERNDSSLSGTFGGRCRFDSWSSVPVVSDRRDLPFGVANCLFRTYLRPTAAVSKSCRVKNSKNWRGGLKADLQLKRLWVRTSWRTSQVVWRWTLWTFERLDLNSCNLPMLPLSSPKHHCPPPSQTSSTWTSSSNSVPSAPPGPTTTWQTEKTGWYGVAKSTVCNDDGWGLFELDLRQCCN